MNSINWICTQKGKKLCLCSVDSGTHTKTLVCVLTSGRAVCFPGITASGICICTSEVCTFWYVHTHLTRLCADSVTTPSLGFGCFVGLVVFWFAGGSKKWRSGLYKEDCQACHSTFWLAWSVFVLDLGICFELYKIKIRCETLTNCAALRFVEIHWIWFMIVVVYDGV